VSCINIVDLVFEQSLVNDSSANTAYCIAEILVGANFRIRLLQEIFVFLFSYAPAKCHTPLLQMYIFYHIYKDI